MAQKLNTFDRFFLTVIDRDLLAAKYEMVIASDYFKRFLAGLINLFGGRLTPFESMLDRARREAVLRMKDKAIELNAAYVFNIKFETTRIGAGSASAMEMVAYGTAMIPGTEPRVQSVPGAALRDGL